ncbi:MAG: hypothetical protein JWN44_7258 [Myxococcales bacterium]|nr:hypothetical protein [Myxococcales bacterium]
MLATRHTDMLSLNAASRLLKERGLRPHARHTIMYAIMRGRLKVAATAEKMMFIRRTELERYASTLVSS